MVTFAQLRTAKPDLWRQAAYGWFAEAGHAAAAADGLRARGVGQLDEHWPDPVGNMAKSTMVRLADSYECANDDMLGARMILDGFADALSYAQSLLNNAIALAEQSGLVVTDLGVYSPRGPANPNLITVQALVLEALREAADADTRTVLALRGIHDAVGVTDPTRAVQVDQVAASQAEVAVLAAAIPTGKDPRVVAQWWRSLSPTQQQQIQYAEPTLIAGLDGIPKDVQQSLRGPGSFDRMKAVQYALDHATDGGLDQYTNNCANFVSTSLRAGGADQHHNSLSGDSDSDWYKGPKLGLDLFDEHGILDSKSWYNARGLHDFLVHDGGTEIDPSQAKPGDVVFFRQDSPTSDPGRPEGSIHHAAMITSVIKNPDGSLNDIKYSQHSDDLQNLSLSGRHLHEATAEGRQKLIFVRVNEHGN